MDPSLSKTRHEGLRFTGNNVEMFLVPNSLRKLITVDNVSIANKNQARV